MAGRLHTITQKPHDDLRIDIQRLDDYELLTQEDILKDEQEN